MNREAPPLPSGVPQTERYTMGQILERLSWLVTVRPYITIIVLLLITVAMGAGSTFRAPPTEGADVAFLPPGHAIATATQEIDEHFGDSGEYSVVTLIFRGQSYPHSAPRVGPRRHDVLVSLHSSHRPFPASIWAGDFPCPFTL